LAISPRGEPATYVDGLLAELGLRRNIVLTIPHFLAAPLIVACTDLIAIIDESIARLFANDARLSIFELPMALRPITIDMLAAAARTEEAALTWLCEQCVEVSAITEGRKSGAAVSPPRMRKKRAAPLAIDSHARTRLVHD
jgi:DNA-binding transcriptional LysR family regulator